MSEATDFDPLRTKCWKCFDTGKIVDAVIKDGEVIPGPDDGKPCYCEKGKTDG